MTPLIGYVAAHEQFSAPDLVEYGVLAEEAGFDALWTSDHFHPWQDNQGHAGHAWLTLAALGQRTRRIVMGTGVTCPASSEARKTTAWAMSSGPTILATGYPASPFTGGWPSIISYTHVGRNADDIILLVMDELRSSSTFPSSLPWPIAVPIAGRSALCSPPP